MEIGLAEREAAFLDMEVGAYHSVEILIPTPDAIHGSSSPPCEDPFVCRLEKVGADHKRLAVTHVDVQREIIDLVVGPAVGCSQHVWEIAGFPRRRTHRRWR